jgi:hypothetical protein
MSQRVAALVDVVVQPDIWTKLTAIGTIGSVAAAMILAGWAGLAGRRARRRQDDREARAEARKVVSLPGHVDDLWPTDDGGQELVIKELIQIVNAGDEPILEVRMVYGGSDKGNETMDDWQWMHGSGSSYSPLVLANDRFSFGGRWQVIGSNEQKNPSNADRGGFFGVVTWSDARNRHWIRRGRDQPVELQQRTAYGQDPVPTHRRDTKSRTIKDARALWAKNKADLDQARASTPAEEPQ